MGNCLVTKLKAVVDNDNLVPFGYVKVASIGGSDITLTREEFSICNDSGVCKLSGDGYFINNNGENAGKDMAFAERPDLGPNEGIHINSGIINVFAPYEDIKSDLHMENTAMIDIDIDAIYLSFKKTSSNFLSNLEILKGNVSGSVTHLLRGYYVCIENFNGEGLTGNIFDADLSYTSVPRYIYLINNSLLEGRVDDLLDKIALTCSDGSFDFMCTGSPKVTFEGESCASVSTPTSITISNHTWSTN